jgi:hypothetical protein
MGEVCLVDWLLLRGALFLNAMAAIAHGTEAVSFCECGDAWLARYWGTTTC